MPIPILAAAAAKAVAAKAAAAVAAKAVAAKVVAGTAAKAVAGKAVAGKVAGTVAAKAAPLAKGKLSISMLADKGVNVSPGTVTQTTKQAASQTSKLDMLKDKGKQYLESIKEGGGGERRDVEFSKPTEANLSTPGQSNGGDGTYSEQIQKLKSLQ